MKTMMRYNDFMHDPLSKNDAGLAISSRYDLRGPGASGVRKCDGALDAKISSFNLFVFLLFFQYLFCDFLIILFFCRWRNGGKVHLIFGPTDENVPKFAYEDGYCGPQEGAHAGIPVEFNFGWNEF